MTSYHEFDDKPLAVLCSWWMYLLHNRDDLHHNCSAPGLPLTAYGHIIRQKNWPKRPKLDGPEWEYGAQNKMAGVHVRRKIICRRTYVWQPLCITFSFIMMCVCVSIWWISLNQVYPLLVLNHSIYTLAYFLICFSFVRKRRKSKPPAYRTPKNRPPGIRRPTQKAYRKPCSAHAKRTLFSAKSARTLLCERTSLFSRFFIS